MSTLNKPSGICASTPADYPTSPQSHDPSIEGTLESIFEKVNALEEIMGICTAHPEAPSDTTSQRCHTVRKAEELIEVAAHINTRFVEIIDQVSILRSRLTGE